MIPDLLHIPEVLHHGTNAIFDTFDLFYKGSNTSYNNTVHGFFFTEKIEHAHIFGNRIISAELSIFNPINLTIQGIFTIESQAPLIWEIISGDQQEPLQALRTLDDNIGLGEIRELLSELNTPMASEMIKAAGYDAIISDMGDQNMEYIVFDPGQIKILSTVLADH